MNSIKSLAGFLALTMLLAIVFAEAKSPAYAAKARKHVENSNPPSLWNKIDEARMPGRAKRLLSADKLPDQFRVFGLNVVELSRLMPEMPMEFADSFIALNT